MNSTQFLTTLFPGFVAGLQKLHNVLITPAAVICIAGMYLRLLRGGESLEKISAVLVRLGIVIIVIGQIYTLGDLLTSVANNLVTQTGWNPDQNIWQDYQTAIATKYQPVPGQTGLSFLFNAVQATWIAAWGLFVYGTSIFAAGLMMIMRLIQAILINIEMGLSPLFLSVILVPSLVGIATRWGTVFIALTLWPIAFAISDLGTKMLMDIAVNSSNNVVVGSVNVVGGSTGVWFFLAIWVIFSSVMGPILISKAIVHTGDHGLNLIPAALMGAIMAGTSMAKGAAGNVAAGANTAMTLSSPSSQSRQNSSNVTRPGFANSRP